MAPETKKTTTGPYDPNYEEQLIKHNICFIRRPKNHELPHNHHDIMSRLCAERPDIIFELFSDLSRIGVVNETVKHPVVPYCNVLADFAPGFARQVAAYPKTTKSRKRIFPFISLRFYWGVKAQGSRHCRRACKSKKTFCGRKKRSKEYTSGYAACRSIFQKEPSHLRLSQIFNTPRLLPSLLLSQATCR
ncbi:hypothetical protein F5883DRAFT_55186 [Diaporthe sp. PMI_573]|nr:hypothetical protein F5883DRAFT_55186 [Diaporthaceae sp. PMI_573]